MAVFVTGLPGNSVAKTAISTRATRRKTVISQVKTAGAIAFHGFKVSPLHMGSAAEGYCSRFGQIPCMCYHTIVLMQPCASTGSK